MIQKLVALPIKQVGLALSDPKETACSHHAVSKDVCSHLLAAFIGGVYSNLEEHCDNVALIASLTYESPMSMPSQIGTRSQPRF
jgi:hypothetical protein